MSSRNSEDNDETEKLDATSKYTINQYPNKTDKPDESEDESKTVVSKKQLDDDHEYPILDIDADLIEAIQHINKAKDKIRRFVKDDKLPIEDLVAFEDKIDDIVGVELDSFVTFVATSYLKSKDKYWLTWSELWKILVQDWPVWEHKRRNEHMVDDWIQMEKSIMILEMEEI